MSNIRTCGTLLNPSINNLFSICYPEPTILDGIRSHNPCPEKIIQQYLYVLSSLYPIASFSSSSEPSHSYTPSNCGRPRNRAYRFAHPVFRQRSVGDLCGGAGRRRDDCKGERPFSRRCDS